MVGRRMGITGSRSSTRGGIQYVIYTLHYVRFSSHNPLVRASLRSAGSGLATPCGQVVLMSVGQPKPLAARPKAGPTGRRSQMLARKERFTHGRKPPGAPVPDQFAEPLLRAPDGVDASAPTAHAPPLEQRQIVHHARPCGAALHVGPASGTMMVAPSGCPPVASTC